MLVNRFERALREVIVHLFSLRLAHAVPLDSIEVGMLKKVLHLCVF